MNDAGRAGRRLVARTNAYYRLAGDGIEMRGQHITPFLTLLPDNPAPRCTLDSFTALFIVAHSSRLARTFAIDVTEGAQLTLKEAQQFSTELSYRLQVTWAMWVTWATWALWAMRSCRAVEWCYTAMW